MNRLNIPARKYYASDVRPNAKRDPFYRRVHIGDRCYWNESRTEYYCYKWPAGWRDLGDVHDICRKSDEISSRLVDHNGWYCDYFQSGVIRGRVLQLPASKAGTARYMPGTYCTEWDGVTLYPGDMCDSLRDAVIRADEYAQSAAEEERECQAKESAKLEIEEKREEIKELYGKAIKLLRGMKQANANARRTGVKPDPFLCSELWARVEAYRELIKEARERIAALQDNYRLAVGGE